MDTAIPPGHRRILKKGRLYHNLRKSNFSKGKRRLEYSFQTAVWLDVVSFDAATKTTASITWITYFSFLESQVGLHFSDKLGRNRRIGYILHY